MNKKFLVIFVLLLLGLAGALAGYFITKRIPMDDLNHGNTHGNLQNGGLFFEMDGKVYFSNANDYDCLYIMNPDESDPKRLTTMRAKYINGADGILYFYMDSTTKSDKVKGLGSATNQYGIYRCRANGGDLTCMHRDFCHEVQLCGKYLFYQVTTGGGSLYKIRCDKKDLTQVKDEMISPICYDNGIIYYTGVTGDHNIHTFNTETGRDTTVIYGNYFFPVVQDGYIYYMNADSNYSIWRTNLSNGDQELVTSDRCDCFTVDREHVYYAFSNAKTPALRRCDLNGANKIDLYSGVVNSINLTSRYLYFKVFGNDHQLYHIPLDLSSGAEPFFVISK